MAWSNSPSKKLQRVSDTWLLLGVKSPFWGHCS